MFKHSLAKAGLVLVFSATLSISAFAQLCGGIYPPCPTTTPAPPTTTTPPTSTSGGTTTSTPPSTPTSTASSTSGTPGYTAPSSGYGPGRTIAYVIAPFAVVAATYFIGNHHQIEIHPNAGFAWPRPVDFGNTTAQLRNAGMFGLKAGVSLTDNVQVEGNFAYMSHVESRIAPARLDQSFGIRPQSVFGLLYDVNGVWNFGAKRVSGTRFTPYVTGGIGGLSTEVRQANSALIGGQLYTTDPTTGAAVLSPTRTVIVHDNSAFLSVNYGGGIKATNLWGPVGFRADIRGRTFPNFRGQSLTWPEATAGLTFSFGER